MTLKKKYRDFVKEFEQRIEDYKNKADEYGGPAEKAIAGIFRKLSHRMYPLSMKQWLEEELEGALKREDFEYAAQVKQEIEKL